MPPSFPPTAICAMYHFPRKKMWLSAQPSHYQITYLGCQSERSERLKSCFKTFFTIQHCFDGCDPSYEWKLLEMTQWVIMRDIWMVRIMWCKHGRTLRLLSFENINLFFDISLCFDINQDVNLLLESLDVKMFSIWIHLLSQQPFWHQPVTQKRSLIKATTSLLGNGLMSKRLLW